ncbi:acetyl-CoA carboxylase biotin carboxyl carrier protein subunit [Catalinimonas niigatensis]|uniref:acetyl-CoA carboxylase biotin carboxyl carrier protein subunit n=1 Tax=Catalinimonas niigatensis TaxID=1397264 RepID=UPI002666BD6B|nr:acetyl-CoA carboxylase biotin carboxyl carrier protein subunit [Catalinimonas niigatensis]WPP52532.1 acetyl-CoA carboxylase biotin carboxyl carrier protein subunit [Catalinimonas niigatensis]
MFKATVNDQRQYEIELKSDQTLIDNQEFSSSLSTLTDSTFHLLYKHHSYNVEVVKADYSRKEFLLKLNGKKIKVNLQDRFDQLIEAMGMQEEDEHTDKKILAPMPGLVLQVHVKEGDQVLKGDPLLTLEAMKMENVLKSPGDGTIATVHAETGKSVEKNHLLVMLE